MLAHKVATSTVAAWFTQAQPSGHMLVQNRLFKRLRPQVTWPASFAARAASSSGGSGSAGGSMDDDTAISGFKGFGSFDKQQQQDKKKMSTGDALQNSLAGEMMNVALKIDGRS